MGKVLKIASAVLTVASFIPGIGQVLGISAAIIRGVGVGLGVGTSLLTPKPKAPKVNRVTSDRLHLSLNPNAPRVIAFGKTAIGTDLR